MSTPSTTSYGSNNPNQDPQQTPEYLRSEFEITNIDSTPIDPSEVVTQTFSALENPDPNDDRKTYQKLVEDVLPVIINAEQAQDSALEQGLLARLDQTISTKWAIDISGSTQKTVKDKLNLALGELRVNDSEAAHTEVMPLDKPSIFSRALSKASSKATILAFDLYDKIPGKTAKRKGALVMALGIGASLLANKVGITGSDNVSVPSLDIDSASSANAQPKGGFANDMLNNVETPKANPIDSVDASSVASKPKSPVTNEFLTVDVKNGEGLTHVVDRLADQQGVNLTAPEQYRLEQRLQAQHSIQLQNTYIMENGDLGINDPTKDIGIDKSDFEEELKKLKKKK